MKTEEIVQKLREMGVPEEMLNLPPVFYAPYGFKIVQVNGRMLWTMNSFEEYREHVSKKLGIAKEAVKPKPMGLCTSTSPTMCAGSCAGPNQMCTGEMPTPGQIYCYCFGISN